MLRFQDNVFYVADIFYQPDSANDILIRIPFEDIASNVLIVVADGGIDIVYRYGIFQHLFRRDNYLILLEVAAERIDFINTGNTLQLRSNNPLLNCSQV